MTASALAVVALGALTLGSAGAGVAPAPLPSARLPGPSLPAAEQPLLTSQPLTPELRKRVQQAHAHRAVGSLEAAGCDLALVMTRAAYDRFVDLRHGMKMPKQTDGSVGQVVWCQSRTTTPPDCTALAPIFVRVAHPKQAFEVFSGSVDPPFAPRCAGVHDAKGRFVSGEGPGYQSSRQ